MLKLVAVGVLHARLDISVHRNVVSVTQLEMQLMPFIGLQLVNANVSILYLMIDLHYRL